MVHRPHLFTSESIQVQLFNCGHASEGDEDKVINTALVPIKLAYGIEASDQAEGKVTMISIGRIHTVLL